MLQRPTVVGLLACERTIIEEASRNVSVINHFTRLRVDGFPSPPQRFSVYAILTDGLGEATLALRVVRLDTLEDIYFRTWSTTFRDPLAQIRLLFRLNECSFPVDGRYQIALEANEEIIAQCVVTVHASGA